MLLGHRECHPAELRVKARDGAGGLGMVGAPKDPEAVAVDESPREGVV